MVAPWIMPGLRGGSVTSIPPGRALSPPPVVPGTPVRQESVPAPPEDQTVPQRPSEADTQPAMLEDESGQVRVTRDSPVFPRPDDQSVELAELQAGFWTNVIGTTPEYLEVRLKSLVIAP